MEVPKLSSNRIPLKRGAQCQSPHNTDTTATISTIFYRLQTIKATFLTNVFLLQALSLPRRVQRACGLEKETPFKLITYRRGDLRQAPRGVSI